MKDSKGLWQSCQKYILEQVGQEEYSRLFSRVEFETYRVANMTLVLRVPSSYIYEEIETKYIDVMRVAIFNTFGKIRLSWDIDVVESSKGKGWVLEGNDETMAPDQSVLAAKENIEQQQYAQAPGSANGTNLPPIDTQLNPMQTFRTFIEGTSNNYRAL